MMNTVLKTIVAGAALSLGWTMSAQAQSYTLKIASPTINDFVQDWAMALKEGIEKRTNGRVKVEHYPASQLGGIPTTLDGVSLGTVEIAIASLGFLIPFDERFQVLDAPGVYESVDHARRIFTDPAMRKQLNSYAANKGLQTLWVAASGDMAVVSRKPIRNVEEFKGMKLRVTGSTPFYVNPLRALGASPVAMSLGEVLPGLQSGTIDGAVAGINYYPFVKYYDAAKYSTILPRNMAITSAVISRSLLKSMGPELSAAVIEESIKAEKVLYERAEATNKLGKEIWLKNGGEIFTFDEANSKKYLELSSSAISPILASTPEVKTEYDRLLQVSGRLRNAQ